MASKNDAAIILLGMGETCAAEVLKTFDKDEVQSIIESMNSIGQVTESQVIKALNSFFKETKTVGGLDTTNDYVHNTLVHAIGQHKAEALADDAATMAKYAGLELMKWQPLRIVIDAIKDEHPQIITVCLMCLESDKAAEILQEFPSDLRKNIISRMTSCDPVSQFAMQSLSTYLESKFTGLEKFNDITTDAAGVAAKIISQLDVETESEIMEHISKSDEELGSVIETKLFPFEKLTELEQKSLQTLLTEAQQEDLVLALKGADENIKTIFFDHMSAKTVDLLKDDMESTGPVKLSDVLAAQKRIVDFAKQLSKEEKIFIPSSKAGGDSEMVG